MKPDHYFSQSGVIPYKTLNGVVFILLITTRSDNWTIPKGIVEDGMTPAASAAKEAYEEAGIEGAVEPGAVGSFRYNKWGGVCDVEVFLMRVQKTHEKWDEDFRNRKWFSVREAALKVKFPGLRPIIRSAGKMLAQRPESP